MNKLMTAMNVKTVALGTLVLATLSCFISESAEARLRFSGTSNTPGIDINSLEIDSNVLNSEQGGELGVFNGAITNFEFQLVPEDVSIIGQPPIQSGSLKASRLLDSDLTQFNLTFDNLINESDNQNAERFRNGGVKYEATFGSNPISFTFFVPLPNSGEPFDESNLINSLSDLEAYLQQFNLDLLPGILKASPPISNPVSDPDGDFYQGYGLSCRTDIGGTDAEWCENFNLDSGAESLRISSVSSAKVPEPNVTLSLLGFGIIGAASLLKRNGRFKSEENIRS